MSIPTTAVERYHPTLTDLEQTTLLGFLPGYGRSRLAAESDAASPHPPPACSGVEESVAQTELVNGCVWECSGEVEPALSVVNGPVDAVGDARVESSRFLGVRDESVDLLPGGKAGGSRA